MKHGIKFNYLDKSTEELKKEIGTYLCPISLEIGLRIAAQAINDASHQSIEDHVDEIYFQKGWLK